MNFKRFIEKAPKVELHLHLDGAFTLDCLLELIRKYGEEPGINSVTDLEKRFKFRNLNHFIETWFWKNRFFREVEDFEESTYHTLKKMASENIVYSEAFISPWDYRESGVSPVDIVIANRNAVKRAKNDFGITCKLIVDITRDHGHEHALDRLDGVSPFIGDDVIGIGLGGSEQQYPAYLFKEVFLEAKKRGFHRVAHAGEVVGPESVWSAIHDLQVERIGHGVRSIEDPNLVRYLRESKIPLEVCIISNLKTKVYSKIDEHPVYDLFHKGIIFSVNSDDPTMFGSSLDDEYVILYEKYAFSLREIKRIQMNAIASSFASNEEKQKLTDQLNRFWTKNVF